MFKFKQLNQKNSSETQPLVTDNEFSDGWKDLFIGIKLTSKHLKIIAKKPEE
jgi:hypothetical protein